MPHVADDDHHSMNDIFNDGLPISVLASTDLRPSDRPAYHVPPTPARLQSTFP